MAREIKEKATVERAGAIEIRHPDLKAGAPAEVTILIDPARETGREWTTGTPRIWEVAAEIARTAPDSEWERLPTDLSKNLDHYLYGAANEED